MHDKLQCCLPWCQACYSTKVILCTSHVQGNCRNKLTVMPLYTQSLKNLMFCTLHCLTVTTQENTTSYQIITNLFENWNVHIRCCVWNAPIALSRLCQPVDIMKMITTNTTWWEDYDNIYEIVPLTCLVISGHGLLVSINSILLYHTLISITNSFMYMFQLKSCIMCFLSCEWAEHNLL